MSDNHITVDIGDYVTDESGVMFHITDDNARDVINVNKIATRKATRDEIREYHKED